MPEFGTGPPAGDDTSTTAGLEVRRQEALLKTGALQTAILTSANFSIIATDEKGIIQDAKIVPPTSQNQKAIEIDLRQYVAPRVEIPVDQLRAQCEQVIRNYDPCISCATHFLKLDVEREA